MTVQSVGLPYTEERMVPEAFDMSNRLFQEHLARYRYVIKQSIDDFAAGKIARILDAPCGEGYGVDMMARQLPGVLVTGVDNDEEAITHAREKYKRWPQNRWMHLDLDKRAAYIDLPSRHYQIVTCFEGIEHVQKQAAVARLLCDVLTPNGTIYVSTPRRGGPGGGSPFHTYELTKEELISLFAPHLSSWSVLAQDYRVGDSEPDENARFYVLVGRR